MTNRILLFFSPYLFYFSRLEQGHTKDNEFGGLFPCFPVLFIMDDKHLRLKVRILGVGMHISFRCKGWQKFIEIRITVSAFAALSSQEVRAGFGVAMGIGT